VPLPSFFRDHRVAIGLIAVSSIAIAGYVAAPSFFHAAPPPASAATSGVASTGLDANADVHDESASAPSITSGSAKSAGRTDAAAPVDPQLALSALRLGLASTDEATRIAAVEAAVSSTAIDTLGDLEKLDLARDPETAPTVIHAVALLGASAEGAQREEAARTLDRWLHEETRREGPDVPGNVSNLVEALGDVGGSNAVDALDALLDRQGAALHVQTLAVMKLGELADSRSRPSVERFAKRAAALPAADGIDEELRVEAIQAARETLTKI
jgi:hypothetical protein